MTADDESARQVNWDALRDLIERGTIERPDLNLRGKRGVAWNRLGPAIGMGERQGYYLRDGKHAPEYETVLKLHLLLGVAPRHVWMEAAGLVPETNAEPAELDPVLAALVRLVKAKAPTVEQKRRAYEILENAFELAEAAEQARRSVQNDDRSAGA